MSDADGGGDGDESIPFPADETQTQQSSQRTASTTTATPSTDDASVGSGCSSNSKAEERRRRREHWRREHENQLRVDGTFPRRHSSISKLGGDADRQAVSARVVSQSHLGTKSTASPHTLPPAVSDSVRVRSNLLRTLGIQKKPVVMEDVKLGESTKDKAGGHRRIQSADGRSLLLGLGGGDIPVPGKTNATANRSLLSAVRMKEELKYDSDDDLEPNNAEQNSYSRFFGVRQSSSADSKLPKNFTHIPRRRRLVFSDDVVVVPIPMRSEYSNRIKERMYSNRVELSENAQRNVVEFEAEGWDASTVLDDEGQFYKCPLTGELIHPVHLAYFKGAGEGGDDQR
eukprot:g11832.t1 g11832   contig6:671999-673027(+)